MVFVFNVILSWCQVPRFELVAHQSWGITLSHVRTRRAPNAFNFLRQLEILKKSGSECGMTSFEVLRLWLRWKSHFCWVPGNACFFTSTSCCFKSLDFRPDNRLQEWTSATAFQKAFEIGESEAQAVVNLLSRIPEEIVADLQAAVRVRGMRNWISHQMLARDIFNVGFSSAVNTAYESWGDRLVNGSGNALETCPSFGKLLSENLLHSDFKLTDSDFLVSSKRGFLVKQFLLQEAPRCKLHCPWGAKSSAMLCTPVVL